MLGVTPLETSDSCSETSQSTSITLCAHLSRAGQDRPPPPTVPPCLLPHPQACLCTPHRHPLTFLQISTESRGILSPLLKPYPRSPAEARCQVYMEAGEGKPHSHLEGAPLPAQDLFPPCLPAYSSPNI